MKNHIEFQFRSKLPGTSSETLLTHGCPSKIMLVIFISSLYWLSRSWGNFFVLKINLVIYYGCQTLRFGINFIYSSGNLFFHKLILFRSARSRNNSGNEGTAEEYYIDMIVSRHARKLLGAYRLRDLALFAAHLDYKLVNWIGKER